MNHSTLLPDATALAFDQFIAEDTGLILRVHSVQKVALCPLCKHRSIKRHSFYWRKLADLPFSGIAVQLSCRVQKFFCHNELCRQEVFVERLPQVAALFARRTQRLEKVWNCLAFLVGGRPGARISRQLALPTSRDTLIRQIRLSVKPEFQTPRALGVDDFALRHGQVYGTILIDLERHQPVDLLTSRDAGVLTDWLKAHSGIEIVSRDRSPIYAAAIDAGAPDAEQVADRFHLLKNIFEVIERILHRKRKSIDAIAEKVRQTARLAGAGDSDLPITLTRPKLLRKTAEKLF